jgi:predicted ester cyclase
MMATPKQALLAAQERWNAGDHEGYLRLYDDRIQLYGLGPEPLDKAGVRGFYDVLWAAFEDPHLEFHEILEAGDTATVRFTMSARHVGEFMGVPPTGRDIALPGITTLRFDGDRCVERHTQTDMLGLMVQLGAVPAPA